MNETTILLSPSPGDPSVRPDFLATVEPLVPRDPSFSLPFEVVLDGYTREPWSAGGTTRGEGGEGGGRWETCHLVSTDGRDRLSGFLKYLRERKKAAVARFESEGGGGGDGGTSSRAVLVVPHDPPPIPEGDLPEGVDRGRVMFVKYLGDESALKGGSREQRQMEMQRKLQEQKMREQKMQQQKLQQQKMQQQKMIQQQKQRQLEYEKSKSPGASSGKKRGGLLGNLLGRQRRVEDHLDTVRSKKTPEGAHDPTAGAAGCINAFRSKVLADLETFKADPTTFVAKVPISLGQLAKDVPAAERDRVTMDVFKFTVHEAVEEVGGDGWIAAREPGGFLDECVVAVYKEGHCPPEVLEEINKGEMPDEIKGAAKHVAEEQTKALQKKGGKGGDGQILRQSNEMGGTGNAAALNTNKRDRRTMEQIQRDMLQGDDGKRSRFD